MVTRTSHRDGGIGGGGGKGEGGGGEGEGAGGGDGEGRGGKCERVCLLLHGVWWDRVGGAYYLPCTQTNGLSWDTMLWSARASQSVHALWLGKRTYAACVCTEAGHHMSIYTQRGYRCAAHVRCTGLRRVQLTRASRGTAILSRRSLCASCEH